MKFSRRFVNPLVALVDVHFDEGVELAEANTADVGGFYLHIFAVLKFVRRVPLFVAG